MRLSAPAVRAACHGEAAATNISLAGQKSTLGGHHERHTLAALEATILRIS
jgi:hypothetical protein